MRGGVQQLAAPWCHRDGFLLRGVYQPAELNGERIQVAASFLEMVLSHKLPSACWGHVTEGGARRAVGTE